MSATSLLERREICSRIASGPQAKLRELLPDRLAATHPELLVRTPIAPEMMGAADPPRISPASSRT